MIVYKVHIPTLQVMNRAYLFPLYTLTQVLNYSGSTMGTNIQAVYGYVTTHTWSRDYQCTSHVTV